MPNYKNWINDRTLANPYRLQKTLDRIEKRGQPDFITSGAKLADGKYSIIGTVTLNAIDFDVENYVEYVNINGDLIYRDYKVTTKQWACFQDLGDGAAARNSFYSILQVNGFILYKKLLILQPIT